MANEQSDMSPAPQSGPQQQRRSVIPPRMARVFAVLIIVEALIFCILAAFFRSPQTLHTAALLIIASSSLFTALSGKRQRGEPSQPPRG